MRCNRTATCRLIHSAAQFTKPQRAPNDYGAQRTSHFSLRLTVFQRKIVPKNFKEASNRTRRVLNYKLHDNEQHVSRDPLQNAKPRSISRNSRWYTTGLAAKEPKRENTSGENELSGTWNGKTCL